MTHNSAPALSPHRRNRRSERHERHRPLHGQGSPSAPAAASAAPGLMAAGVASSDNEEWSLYGAPWLQPAAISGKSTGSKTRRNKQNRLPPAATSCARRSMVRRGSPVRVRKRASRKSCTAAFSAARPFAYIPQRSVVELFLDTQDFHRRDLSPRLATDASFRNASRWPASLNHKAHNPEVAGFKSCPRYCPRHRKRCLGRLWRQGRVEKLLPNFLPASDRGRGALRDGRYSLRKFRGRKGSRRA